MQLSGTSGGAPAFPASLANAPAGFVLPRQSITAVDPAFRTQSAWLTNVQLERAIASELSSRSGLRQLGRPATAGPDGREPDSNRERAARCPTDLLNHGERRHARDPTFDHVNVFQSIGEAGYNAFTATMTKRMTHGFQAQATYTFAQARTMPRSPAPTLSAAATIECRIRPTSIERRHAIQQAHTFAVSTVIAPEIAGTGWAVALANNNQLGLILQANSGLPFNIRSRTDLQPGRRDQRPTGSSAIPAVSAVSCLDLRYSRFIPAGDTRRIELFFEAKNLFNTENVATVTRDVTTTAAGDLTAPLPSRSRRRARPISGRCRWVSSLSSDSDSMDAATGRYALMRRPFGRLRGALSDVEERHDATAPKLFRVPSSVVSPCRPSTFLGRP